MATYTERTGRAPSFEVEYRFLSAEERGRSLPPHQHTRWDFLYEGDDPTRDGVWMIWPEFISQDRAVLPDGEVPPSGRALMFIVNLDNEHYHRSRIELGKRGAFVEGAKRVAECTVVSIHALADEADR